MTPEERIEKLERRLAERDKMYATATALLSKNAELATALDACERELAKLKGTSHSP
jgi:hypothetical protein